MDAVTVYELTKRFGHKTKGFLAVDHMSFRLGKGEILGLLGPNGAGKTTTIQMLLGVLTPTSGSISYFDQNLATHREAILEKVNFSSTYTNLPWSLSVHEVLNYTSFLYDLSNRSQRIDEIVRTFRLKKLLDKPLSELSAGQLTRVNLAKSFINEPEVLLLDEPTASLDPEVAKLVRDFILEEREKKNLSVIFTSHNMPEVEEVCDRILFINNGKIVADDTPENLMKQIDTARVRITTKEDNTSILTDFAEASNSLVHFKKMTVTLEMKEKLIPEYLTFLSSNQIEYYEISIDKPDLEDFFLMIAKQNKNRDL